MLAQEYVRTWGKVYEYWHWNFLDPRLRDRVYIFGLTPWHRWQADDQTEDVYVFQFDGKVLRARAFSKYHYHIAPHHLIPAVDRVMNSKIDNLLDEDDELVRGLMILDRRFGRRRLPLLMFTEERAFSKLCVKMKLSVWGQGKG